MPVIEIAKVIATDGDAFATRAPKALEIIATADGCTGGTAHRCVERPDEFILLVNWTDVDAHLSFRETETFGAYRAVIADLLAEPPTFLHYSQVG